MLGFTDGEVSKTFSVPILDNRAAEPAEFFAVVLANPTGGAVLGARSLGFVAILDDDALAAVGARPGIEPRVRVFLVGTGRAVADFLAFPATFTGGVRVAVGDVTGDGALDVLAATGPGAEGRVRVYDGASLRPGPTPALIPGPLGDFAPYPGFAGGLFVAAGDLLARDGRADLVVAPDGGFLPGLGMAPPLLALSGADGALLGGGWVYEPAFTGGVRVALADVSGDSTPDLVAAPGPGRAAEVRVLSGSDGALLRSFAAFEAAFTGGAFVCGGDLTGDGRAEVVVRQGAGTGTDSLARVYDVSGAGPVLLRELAPYAGFGGAVRVALADVSFDGRLDLITVPGAGLAPRARAFDPLSGALLGEALVFDLAFLGGAFVAAG